MNGGLLKPKPSANTIDELSKQKAIENMQKLAEEEVKRLQEIADKVENILIKENVTIKELPLITSLLTGKINNKFDQTSIEKLLKL